VYEKSDPRAAFDIHTMNTFKNDSDRETQSLLGEEVIIDAKKKQKSALFNTRNVLLVGGLVATGGMVGLSGHAKSAASSQNATTAYKLGQDRPTIRLSVGCTPQDVLSLLPFEPKSWRGALLMIVSVCRRRRHLVFCIVSLSHRSSRDSWGNFALSAHFFLFFDKTKTLH
jgi:hypothetical protein